MKAYMSDRTGVLLRPDLYESDRDWLCWASKAEAERVLAETEPNGWQAFTASYEHGLIHSGHGEGAALAAALAVALESGAFDS